MQGKAMRCNASVVCYFYSMILSLYLLLGSFRNIRRRADHISKLGAELVIQITEEAQMIPFDNAITETETRICTSLKFNFYFWFC